MPPLDDKDSQPRFLSSEEQESVEVLGANEGNYKGSECRKQGYGGGIRSLFTLERDRFYLNTIR